MLSHLFSNKFGKLKVLKLLGKGGQASVFLSKDEQGRKFAAKIYDCRLNSDISIILKKKCLKHKNIIKVLDKNVSYLDKQGVLLPYYPMGDLHGFFKRTHSLNWENTFSYDIFTAIGECHENEIAHRDIKPANFLIASKEDTYSAILCDFGLATNAYKIKRSGGTFSFAAPEVLKRETYNYKCDIWSAGMTVLYMNAGERFILNLTNKKIPFDFDFLLKNHERIVKNFSEDTKFILNASLQKNPEERLEAKEILKIF
jgi:serine/threonine protein kinase